MWTKLLMLFSIAFVVSQQPANALAKSLPGSHHSCHSHHYYHHSVHHDHFIEGFCKTRDKQWTDWGAFFDYLCIGPVGATCGIVGVVRKEVGAGVVMAIGLIETGVEAACLSR